MRKWEQDIRDRELAEKRRVAPGWLDSDAKILQPEKRNVTAAEDLLTGEAVEQKGSVDAPVLRTDNAEGVELDRAFGGMGIR